MAELFNRLADFILYILELLAFVVYGMWQGICWLVRLVVIIAVRHGVWLTSCLICLILIAIGNPATVIAGSALMITGVISFYRWVKTNCGSDHGPTMPRPVRDKLPSRRRSF